MNLLCKDFWSLHPTLNNVFNIEWIALYFRGRFIVIEFTKISHILKHLITMFSNITPFYTYINGQSLIRTHF